jgi:hypothetical protein
MYEIPRSSAGSMPIENCQGASADRMPRQGDEGAPDAWPMGVASHSYEISLVERS